MEPLVNPFYPIHAFMPDEKERTTFEQLAGCFTAHERDEQQFLKEYWDISERHENPLMRFLLQMIMSDEEKHHAVVHSITETLNSDLVGMRTAKGLPKLGQISAEEKEALLNLTAEFIQTEQDGIKQYKALLRPSKNLYGGLLVLLIETIIHDSEKHLMILEFVDRKLRDS
jgi:bacterioferritin (cytochrome b1)